MRRLIILVALTIGGCQALQLPTPIRMSDSDWWTNGGSASRAGVAPRAIAPPLEQAWEYNALAAFGPGSPLVLGDVVIVANLQGEVHAINFEDGKRVGQDKFREAIRGTPALPSKRIIVANAWGNRTVQAYDLERARRAWHRDLNRVEAGLLAHGDAVLMADMLGVVRLMDEATGVDRWVFEDPNEAAIRADPLLVGDAFVVFSEDGSARAFDAETGELRWQAGLGAPVYTTPAAAGNMVYVPTTQGTLLAVDARSGAEVWRFDTNDTTVRIASPAVSGDVIYFGASDALVRAISTDYGAPVWRAGVEAAVSAQPLVAGGYVYVGTMQNRLIALDFETGGEIWSTELRGRIKSGMAPAGDGIVVLTEPRFVTYFRPEAALASN